MKKINCLFFTLFFIIIISHAQKSTAIVRGGVNFANVTVTDDGSIDEAKTLTSFQVGIIGDLYVAPFFSIQPGVLLTGKGSKSQSGQSTDANYFKATTNPLYIELPVNFVFKGPIGKETKIFAGAGPYLGIGIAGKNKVEGKFLGNAFSSEEDIEWSNDDPSTLNYEEGAGFGIMKRFDYGLNGTAGIEGKNALLSVNYGLGLAKLQSGSDNSQDEKNKHRVFSITLGFKL